MDCGSRKTREAYLEMFLNGYSVSNIAKHFGVSRQAVYQGLDKEGVNVRKDSVKRMKKACEIIKQLKLEEDEQ